MIDNIKEFFSDTSKIIGVLNVIIQLILLFAAVKLIKKFGCIIIDKFFEGQKKSKFGLDSRKADTLSELLKSILRYLLYIVGALSLLDILGFETRTLLVGAGLSGLAIGFGAQSLVKDIISGFFIIFEDQFSVGEYVTIEDMSGIVEAVGLRITKIKDFSGDLHIIPNGQIIKVTNHSRDNIRALVDVEISYESDIDKAILVLNKVCEEIKSQNTEIVEGPKVLGVTKLGESGISIRIIAKAKPMKHWGVEMELRKLIKERFNEENINIPYPTRVIIKKNGNN